MELFSVEGERVRLRAFRQEDAKSLYSYRTLPEVTEFQSWNPATISLVEKFISDLSEMEFNTPGTWYQLAIVRIEDDELIGDLGLHFIEPENLTVEIGYTLNPDYQGKGYATEALQLCIDHLFLVMRKHRVYASLDPKNKKSEELLLRLGFRKEALFRKSLFINGEWVDDLVYGLLEEDWTERGV